MFGSKEPSEEQVKPKDDNGKKRRKKKDDAKKHDKDKCKETGKSGESSKKNEKNEKRPNSKGKTVRTESPPKSHSNRKDDDEYENSDDGSECSCEKRKYCRCNTCRRKRRSGSSYSSGSSSSIHNDYRYDYNRRSGSSCSSYSGSSNHSDVKCFRGQHITIKAENLYFNDPNDAGHASYIDDVLNVHRSEVYQHDPEFPPDYEGSPKDLDNVRGIPGHGPHGKHTGSQNLDNCPPDNKSEDYGPTGNRRDQRKRDFGPPDNETGQNADYCPARNSVSEQDLDYGPPGNSCHQQDLSYGSSGSFDGRQGSDYGQNFLGDCGAFEGQSCDTNQPGTSMALLQTAPAAMAVLCSLPLHKQKHRHSKGQKNSNNPDSSTSQKHK